MSFSNSSRSAESWGEVRTRDFTARYRRSGAGRALLLLHSAESSEALWPEVLEILISGFRLVVPDPPPAETEVEPWLSLLLEGLGMSNVTVVASDGFCIAALERALLEPDRISRIVLVCRGRGSEGAVDGALDATTPRLASVPLLVLRRDRPATEIVPLVASFLAADGTAPRA